MYFLPPDSISKTVDHIPHACPLSSLSIPPGELVNTKSHRLGTSLPLGRTIELHPPLSLYYADSLMGKVPSFLGDPLVDSLRLFPSLQYFSVTLTSHRLCTRLFFKASKMCYLGSAGLFVRTSWARHDSSTCGQVDIFNLIAQKGA